MAATLVLFACQKERAEEDILVNGNHLTFTATIDGVGTRTSVDGTKISWNPAEEINIFYGASEGSKFVSQNTEPSQSVTFSGTLTAFTGTTEAGEPNSFWAIYPYDESNSSSGSSVTAYLPENQVGFPNNVPDKALMMVAKASGLALSFKQVCARIKVNVTTSGIEKIEIRGNNDETIAGSAVITMNSQGLPEWQDAGTGAGKVVELVPASGTTFEVAEYSIPIYPQTFSAGFTMTCYKDGEKGSYSTGAVTFGRNQVRTVSTDRVTEWTVDQPNNVIYYTTTDGNVVTLYYPEAFGANILSNEYVDGRGIITFDGDVTSIGDNALGGCISLASITIPDGVTSIGHHAFNGCRSLASITIPDGVTSIGYHAFNGCTSLVSIMIPDGVTSIELATFANCRSLTSITIPDGVKSIGESAFSDCTSLTSITIPDSVTCMGDSAFQGCTSLTSAKIPDSVTSLGFGVFASCTSLMSFSGKYASPDGLFLIDSGRFIAVAAGAVRGDLAIPDGVTSIGKGAFQNCTNLTGITIPDGVTSIGNNAFSGCKNLTSITIPDGVTSIGIGAFNSCTSLSNIAIPDGVTSLEDVVFLWCTSLSSITIPDGVTSIGHFAFMHCTSLTSITIPESVTSIGNFSFAECSSLTSITIKPESPPAGGGNMFDDTNDCPIYVPASSVDAYFANEFWNQYGYRIQPLAPLPVAVDLGLPSGLKWASFNLGATRPEEYGDYYAWGETEPYYSSQDPLIWKEGKEAGYDWGSYKWCYGSLDNLTKYCSHYSFGYKGFTDTKTVLDPEDDAAHVNLGGKWRMPTDTEWTELIENCTWTWTVQNGVFGRLVTASNGNCIFLPIAGFRHETNLDVNTGYYWSSSLYTPTPSSIWYVNFTTGSIDRYATDRRYGFSVRPVYAE